MTCERARCPFCLNTLSTRSRLGFSLRAAHFRWPAMLFVASLSFLAGLGCSYSWSEEPAPEEPESEIPAPPPEARQAAEQAEQQCVAFPSREYWLSARARNRPLPEGESSEPEWIEHYRQILDSREVTLRLWDTAFTEAIAFLQDISGLNIVISSGVETDGLNVSLRVRKLLLKDALKILLEQVDLTMVFKDESIMITIPDVEPAAGFVLEIMDVQDLLGGGEEELEKIIRTSIGEDNWEEPASIETHRGQLIINQTRGMHHEIGQVLENLRRTSGKLVVVEGRSVSVTDDLLRDLGIDLRCLDPSPESEGASR